MMRHQQVQDAVPGTPTTQQAVAGIPGGGGLLPRLCLHEPAGRQLIGVVGDDFSDRCPNGIKHVGVPMEEGLLP